MSSNSTRKSKSPRINTFEAHLYAQITRIQGNSAIFSHNAGWLHAYNNGLRELVNTRGLYGPEHPHREIIFGTAFLCAREIAEECRYFFKLRGYRTTRFKFYPLRGRPRRIRRILDLGYSGYDFCRILMSDTVTSTCCTIISLHRTKFFVVTMNTFMKAEG